jgi:hypothetical protein
LNDVVAADCMSAIVNVVQVTSMGVKGILQYIIPT